MKGPVVSFEVSMDFVWLWAACLLIFKIVFLLSWRISVGFLVLELAGSWVELGLRVVMELLGRDLVY